MTASLYIQPYPTPLLSTESSFLCLTHFLSFNSTSFNKNESSRPFHTASAAIHILHFRHSGTGKVCQTFPASGLHRDCVHEDPLSIPMHPIPISLCKLNNTNPSTTSPGCLISEPIQGPPNKKIHVESGQGAQGNEI